MRDGWAATRRRRWSASRIGAAIALHVLVLTLVTLAIDRVEMPRPGADRATTLLAIVLPAPTPPAAHVLPLPPPMRPQLSLSLLPAPDVRPPQTEPQPITLPAPGASPAAATAAAPASAAAPDLRFLDADATRLAIRGAARTRTLADQANAITGSRRTAGERLAAGVEAAHKADCMKAGGSMGLLAAPVILVAEAMGKCAHKL